MKKHVKSLFRELVAYVPIRRLFEAIPFLNARLSGWQRTHPFDRQYGIETSGFTSVNRITSDPELLTAINPYAGSQPSIIRRAIVALQETDEYTFVDLGCGKGRVLLVASEFAFQSLIGVELSPQLAKIARRNIAYFKRHHPELVPITVAEGNAISWPFPEGKLVLFLYHSFSEALVSLIVKRLEAALAKGAEHIFFISYNPVYGHVLDASPAFTRWYAANLPYDASEVGFGPDARDTVIIWQSVRGAKTTPHANVREPIIIQIPGWRAEVSLLSG